VNIEIGERVVWRRGIKYAREYCISSRVRRIKEKSVNMGAN